MRSALAALLILVIISTISSATKQDDSDASTEQRSGMRVRTDHLTGCQYLTTVSAFGDTAIMPRMGSDGRQVCRPIDSPNPLH